MAKSVNKYESAANVLLENGLAVDTSQIDFIGINVCRVKNEEDDSSIFYNICSDSDSVQSSLQKTLDKCAGNQRIVGGHGVWLVSNE